MSDQANFDLVRELANNKEIFRLLVDGITDYSIFMLDTKGYIVTWNSGAQRITGYNAEHVVGKHFSLLYTEEAKNTGHPDQGLVAALDKGRYEEEGWRVRRDGSALWANVVITPVFDDEKNHTGFAKITRDLTDQKSASQNEQIFKLLVESVSDYAIFMLDPNGMVMTWNEGAERIKGYKAHEIIGKHFSQFYTQEAKDRKHPQYELEFAARTGRYEEEGWRLRKDGSSLWANVTISAVHDYNGELRGFAKVTRDLTERKLASQHEKTFRLLVNSVSDYAIFMLDPEGNVLTWNDGAKRIKGYEANEIIGKHFSIFYTREAQKRRHPQNELEIAKECGRYEEEGWRLRKDGSLIWANVVITAVYDDKGLIGFAKVTRDLTQRLLADQEREMSAKLLDETNNDLRRALEVKSRFLSTISHEVRTPMAGIIGLTELLCTEDLGTENNTLVSNIFDSSKRLLQLLNNLLQQARMDAGEIVLEKRNFSIRAVIGDIRQLISAEAQKKQIRVTGTCDDQIPLLVIGDELKVRQVLLNLAHNAVKFTDSGLVDISVEQLHRTNSNTRIRFTVTDTGIGIKPQDQAKIFKPFEQAQDSTKRIYGGTGLGLSISKQLAESMDGKITFETEYDTGSKFFFELTFAVGS